jgi:hypothetical protein
MEVKTTPVAFKDPTAETLSVPAVPSFTTVPEVIVRLEVVEIFPVMTYGLPAGVHVVGVVTLVLTVVAASTDEKDKKTPPRTKSTPRKAFFICF